jgi:hypothetical protein
MQQVPEAKTKEQTDSRTSHKVSIERPKEKDQPIFSRDSGYRWSNMWNTIFLIHTMEGVEQVQEENTIFHVEYYFVFSWFVNGERRE